MAGIKPAGPEAKIACENFLKAITNLFSNALRGHDVAEDMGPLDVLIAYRDMFNSIDSDHDGKIYPDQLHELVRALTRLESTSGVSRSPDAASTEMIVNHLDKAKKGYVDYSDFLAGALLATEPPAATTEVDNEDTEFVSALGPSSTSTLSSQHDSVFEDGLEWDAKPTSGSTGNSASNVSGGSGSDSIAAAAGAQSLTQMKSQTHMLEQRLSVMQSELNKSEQSRADLLARVSEQEKSIDAFKKQLKSLAETDGERNRMSDELEQLRANLNTTKEALKSAQKNETELATERDRLREDLHLKNKEINDIEDQLRALRESAAGADAAQQMIAALQAQLAAANERYDALVKTKESQDKDHAKLLQALQELQAKHNDLMLEAEDAKRRLAEMSDEQNALTQSQQHRANKGANLKTELTSTMARPMSPAKPGEGFSTSYGSPAPFSLLSESPSAASASNADELLQLRVELDMLNKEKKALLAHLSESKNNSNDKEKQELNDRLQALGKNLTEAERAKGSLQRLYDEAKAELAEMKEQIAASQAAVSAANDAAAKAAASAFVTAPNNPLTDPVQDELRALRLSKHENDSQLTRLRQQAESDSLQLKALRSEVQQLREHNRSLKAKVAQFPDEQVGLDDDLRRGLLGNQRVVRHDKGCCDTCSIL